MRRVARSQRGEEIGLALDRRRGKAGFEVHHRGVSAEVVGECHDGAAMQDPAPVGELIAYGEVCGDTLRRDVGDGDADELSERWLLDRWVRHFAAMTQEKE